MHQFDIVLVKPGSQKQLYGELSGFELTAVEPPLWGAILAGYLRQKGYSVVLLDAEVEGWSCEEAARRVVELRPLLAVVVVSGANPSASTPNMAGAGAIARAVKEQSPAMRTMLWGLHPSALPERTLREEGADFVCQGEGLYTLPKLLDALKAQAGELPIEGLWHWKDGRIVSNPMPRVFPDLGELPMPAWDMLPVERYRAHNWHCFGHVESRSPYAVIYTSLGCPFRCSFCCINALFGKRGIRYRPPERVVEEIDYLVTKRNVRNIKIIDEMFVLKKEHVLRLCDLIAQRGYGLNFWANARVDTVDAELLSAMKRAGINWVCYGFESANESVLNEAQKGYDPKTVDAVVRMTRDAGVYILANYVFGLPEDDLRTMEQTLAQAMEMNAEWANFYCATAYPGSALYEKAVAKGWPLPESWQGYSQHSYEMLPLPTNHLSGPEVLKFRDEAFHRYFSNPAYLEMITRKFGAETAAHVRKMTSHRLKRKYVP